MTVLFRRLYRVANNGPGADDIIAYREASEYICDPRDLDKDGNPPAFFLKQEKIVAEEFEIEFDHIPTEDELKTAFPDFFAKTKMK